MSFPFFKHLSWISDAKHGTIKSDTAKAKQEKKGYNKEVGDCDMKILKRKEKTAQRIFYFSLYIRLKKTDQQRKLLYPTLAHRGGGPSCVILRANRNSASCPWQKNWDVWVMSVQTAGEIITPADRDLAHRAVAAGRVISLGYFLVVAHFL